MTKQLAALFPQYIADLNLHLDDGTLLTADNYRDFIKREIIRAAQIAKNAGAEIPDSLGFTFSNDRGTFAPMNGAMPNAEGGMRKAEGMPEGMKMMRPMMKLSRGRQ